MAAFSASTHKVVVAPTSNLKDALPVDARVMLASLFSTMGIFQVTIGNTAPADKDVLWWHSDVKQFKRYDGVNGNWFPITANQVAMHIFRRAILGSVTEINLETGDLFCFWDVSAGEVKKITREDMMKALGAVRTISTSEGVQGGGDLSTNRALKLDLNGLAAKTNPSGDDFLGLYSVADAAHRKSTVEQVAARVASSDYLHSEMFFFGSM